MLMSQSLSHEGLKGGQVARGGGHLPAGVIKEVRPLMIA